MPENEITTISPLHQRYLHWLDLLRSAHRGFTHPLPTDGPQSREFVDKELLWKQYQMHIDLYKHYLDLVIKFNVFYYAITGAFLSYYVSHLANRLVKWSLIFPIIMSLFFAWVFYKAARVVKYVDDEVMYIAWTLGFTQPEIHVLTYTLVASGGLFGVISIALIAALLLILRGY